jgi:hypothetical protein
MSWVCSLDELTLNEPDLSVLDVVAERAAAWRDGRRVRMCGMRKEPKGICARWAFQRGQREREGMATHVDVARKEQVAVRRDKVERERLDCQARLVL